MPDLALERESGRTVAGVDEVGRGPWAGPVIAAAVIIDADRLPDWLADGVDDSKALTPRRRRELYAGLVAHVDFGIGAASVREIERTNIVRATFAAMDRAVRRLAAPPDIALVDGPLAPPLPCRVRAVVKGDSLSLSIAAASIIAKVTRDRLMASLGRRYPAYGWERNAGYGTADHIAGLTRAGVTAHHRRTWAPIVKILRGDALEIEDIG